MKYNKLLLAMALCMAFQPMINFGAENVKESSFLQRWTPKVLQNLGSYASQKVSTVKNKLIQWINPITKTKEEQLEYLSNKLANLVKAQQNKLKDSSASPQDNTDFIRISNNLLIMINHQGELGKNILKNTLEKHGLSLGNVLVTINLTELRINTQIQNKQEANKQDQAIVRQEQIQNLCDRLASRIKSQQKNLKTASKADNYDFLQFLAIGFPIIKKEKNGLEIFEKTLNNYGLSSDLAQEIILKTTIKLQQQELRTDQELYTTRDTGGLSVMSSPKDCQSGLSVI